MSELSGAVVRLNELAWRPGAFMHAAWWDRLRIRNLLDLYNRSPRLARAVDGLVVRARGFPEGPLPTSLSESQDRLMSLGDRLPTLVLALGLCGLGRSEYILLPAYKQELASWLTSSQCDQLQLFVDDFGGNGDLVKPNAVGRTAQSAGVRWLSIAMPSCPVWRAHEILLAPQHVEFKNPKYDPVALLFKLERFLWTRLD